MRALQQQMSQKCARHYFVVVVVAGANLWSAQKYPSAWHEARVSLLTCFSIILAMLFRVSIFLQLFWPGTEWSSPVRDRGTFCRCPSCRRRTCAAGRRGRRRRGSPSVCRPKSKLYANKLVACHKQKYLQNKRKIEFAIQESSVPNLSDDEPGQCHPRDWADQFDRLPVVDVTVADCELLAFRLVVVNWNVIDAIYGYKNAKSFTFLFVSKCYSF